MEITYIKIDNITYKGFELYYKKEIDNIMTKATIFDSNYKYFYKSPDSIVIKNLGYFKYIGKKSSESRYYDFDYDIYQFDEDFVLCSNKDCIFSIEQQIYYENMVLIEDMFYLKYNVYYKNK
jgi:hypothetical protein